MLITLTEARRALGRIITHARITGEPVTIGLTTVPLHTESDAFLGFLALFTDLTPIRSQNPFEAARLKLIASLSAIKAPSAFPSFPTPDHHAGIAGHLREAAAIFGLQGSL